MWCYSNSTLCLVAFLCFLFLHQAVAQTDFWQQCDGPFGAYTYSMFFDAGSNTVYAGTSHGLAYNSTDQGLHWTCISLGLPKNPPPSYGYVDNLVNALAKSPTGFMFCGMYSLDSSGVFRSSDNGSTWSMASSGLPGDMITTLAVDPDGCIFAGTTNNGVYRSTDNADSWTSANVGLTASDVQTMEVDYVSGNIYAGTGSYTGLFRSTDHGQNWTSIGLTSLNFIQGLTIDNTGQIFACGYNNFNYVVYKSSNFGNSWGGMLTIPASGSPIVNDLEMNNSGNLFIATTRGVFRSTNNGTGIPTLVNNGLTNTKVYSLATDPTTGSIYAGSLGDGAFRSDDNGENWIPAYSGFYSFTIQSAAEGTPNRQFMGTNIGLYYSDDNGMSFIRPSSLVGKNISSMAIDSTGQVFVGLVKPVGSSGGVYRSIDSGLTWVAANTGLTNSDVRAMTVNPSNQNVFAGTYGAGVFKTTDSGVHWFPANTGMSSALVRSLILDSNHFVFAGTANGVYRSTNDGGSWARVDTGLTNLDVRSVIYSQSGALFAGTGGGVFRSSDDGSHWTPTNVGITDFDIRSLVGSVGTVIFAGTNSGIFKSDNEGANWIPVNSGLSNQSITMLAYCQTGGHLLCGTYYPGQLYRNAQPVSSNCLSGHVTSAVTGLPIEGATVTVDGLSTTTGSDGAYTICGMPASTLTAAFTGYPTSGSAPLDVQFTDQSTEATHTVTCSQTGYTTYTNTQVTIPPNTLDISLSDSLPPEEMRLVLNWAANPTDLDSHLLTPNIGGMTYHVWYNDKGNATGPPYATLDHDDVDGYGPETITIVQFFDGTYHYYVHNFSGDVDITQSSAVVQIYTNAGLVQTLHVPTTGTGLYWDVCEIDGDTKAITVINQIVSTPPSGMEYSEMPSKVETTNIKKSQGPPHNRVASITDWLWKFGDGETSTLQNPIHTYQHAGSYTVELTVRNGTDSSTTTKANYISTSGVVTMHCNVSVGWNMVSVPLDIEDYAKSSIYPTATSKAFTYDNRYVTRDTLRNGIGYWLKFANTGNVELTGTPCERETVAVKRGWNMIGSITEPIPVTSIGSDSSGMVTSRVFRYNGSSYQPTDTLPPGEGHWIKVRTAGLLILASSSAATARQLIKIVDDDEMPPLPPPESKEATVILPIEFALDQNFPNPFNPSTVIHYSLPVSGWVTLKVYDLLGREVATLVNEAKQAGKYSVRWDGTETVHATSLPSGIYYFRLVSGRFSETKKTILMR